MRMFGQNANVLDRNIFSKLLMSIDADEILWRLLCPTFAFSWATCGTAIYLPYLNFITMHCCTVGREKCWNHFWRCGFVKSCASYNQFMLPQSRRNLSLHFKNLCSPHNFWRICSTFGQRNQVRKQNKTKINK